MKLEISNRKFIDIFRICFFFKSEPKLQKILLQKGFEGNRTSKFNKAKATGCIELSNACDKKYLIPVISQLN